jgi:hypothetical protein
MRRRALLVVLLGFAGIAAALTPPSGAQSPTFGYGCLPGQPAVAHVAGQALRPQPPGAPVPCATTTGAATAEASLRATRGALFQAPAVFTDGAGQSVPGAHDVESAVLPPSTVKPFAATLPSGVAVSRDGGRSWRTVKPGGATMFTFDHGSYADQRTGRYFLSMYLPTWNAEQAAQVFLTGAEVNIYATDDTGRSWIHSTVCCAHQSENPEFVVNTPPRGVRTHGYPNVVYFCFNVTNAIVYGTRLCTSSLDGGATWASLPSSIALTGDRQQCGPEGPTMSGWPVAGRRGAVLALFNCAGTMVVGSSRDLVRTWTLRRGSSDALARAHGPVDRTSPMPVSVLRTDPRGNLYIAYQAGNRLVYHVSRDAGRTWSSQRDATAPGIRPVIWSFDVGEPGHLAFTYFGNRRAQSGGWRAERDGFVTETNEGLDARPVFWTGMVNPATQPLMYGPTLQGATRASERLDWTKSSIGPDGTARAALWQDCGPTPDAARCKAWDRQTRGYVGWLRWTS